MSEGPSVRLSDFLENHTLYSSESVKESVISPPVEGPSKFVADVMKFMDKFGMNGPLTPKQQRERMALLREEHDETQEAAERMDPVGYIDGLVDLVFVAIGNAIQAGYNFDAHWDAVVKANLAKERGEKPNRPGTGGFDVIKPAGWVGPEARHAELISKQKFTPFG